MTKVLKAHIINLLFLLFTVQSTVAMANRLHTTLFGIAGITVTCLSIMLIIYNKIYSTHSKSFLQAIFYSVQQDFEELKQDVEVKPNAKVTPFEKYSKKFEVVHAKLESAIKGSIPETNTYCQKYEEECNVHKYLLKLFYIMGKEPINICQNFMDKYMSLIKSYMPIFMRTSSYIMKDACVFERIFLLGCKYNNTDAFICMPKMMIHVTDVRFDRFHCLGMPRPLFGRCVEMAYLYQSNDVINLLNSFHTNAILDNILKNRINNNLPFLDNATTIINRMLKKKKYDDYELIANFFETKLREEEQQENDFSIVELMKKSLREDKDKQMLLFVVALKNGYDSLEKILQNIFGITFASKNSKDETLYHVTYEWELKIRIPSARPVISRLVRKEVIDVNAKNSENNTALDVALALCKKREYMSVSAGELEWTNKLTKKYAINELLQHPAIRIGIEGERMASLMCQNLFIAKLFLNHKTFLPDITPFWYYMFFMRAFALKKYKDEDLEQFKTPQIMTRQLQLIPRIKSHVSGCCLCGLYERIEQSIETCVTAGGNITEPDKFGWLPVDAAYAQTKGLEEKDVSPEMKANPKFYCSPRCGAIEKEWIRRRIIYDHYLIHTPDIVLTR